VVERKNRSLEELARTLLNATDLPKYLWTDAVNTTCYVQYYPFILLLAIFSSEPSFLSFALFLSQQPFDLVGEDGDLIIRLCII